MAGWSWIRWRRWRVANVVLGGDSDCSRGGGASRCSAVMGGGSKSIPDGGGFRAVTYCASTVLLMMPVRTA